MPAKFHISKNLAYLPVKKCGTTSITTAFLRMEGYDVDPTSCCRNTLDKHLQKVVACDRGEDRYFFTIVRDPIRRFLSFYSDKILCFHLKRNAIVTNEALGYRTNMSLDDAIEIAVGGKHLVDSHVRPQSDVIDRAGFELDYIGRFESFNESISHVSKVTGRDIPVPILGKRVFSPLRVNQEQFEALSNYYRDDQIRFGYPTDFEIWRELNLDAAGTEFQDRPGITFEGEASLIGHRIECRRDHFELSMNWQMFPEASRHRLIRVFHADENYERNTLFRISPDVKLEAGPDQMVKESVRINYSDLPDDVPLMDIGIEIYFWSHEKRFAPIRGFNGIGTLALALPAIPNRSFIDQVATNLSWPWKG